MRKEVRKTTTFCIFSVSVVCLLVSSVRSLVTPRRHNAWCGSSQVSGFSFRSATRKRVESLWYLFLVNGAVDDDAGGIPGERQDEPEFISSWKDQLNMKPTATTYGAGSRFMDPRRGYYSLDELESFAAARYNQSRTQPLLLYNQSASERENGDDLLRTDDEENGDDSLLLDTEVYLQASVDPDGSIIFGEDAMIGNDDFREAIVRQLSQPSPNSPSAQGYSSNDDNPIQQMWQFMQQQKYRNDDLKRQAAEEVHRQILGQEEGFWQQSALFKASLTNQTKADEAAAYRRGDRFRKEQAKALQQLEEQIKEVEANLTKDARYQLQLQCGACGCVLSQEEIQYWEDTASARKGAIPSCQICYSEQFTGLKQPTRRWYTSTIYPVEERGGLRSQSRNVTYRSPDKNRRMEGVERLTPVRQDMSFSSALNNDHVDQAKPKEEGSSGPDAGKSLNWNETTEDMR